MLTRPAAVKFAQGACAGLLLLSAGGGAWGQAADLVCTACVDTKDLAPNAVMQDRIANGAVDRAKIAANAVATNKIADSAVNTAKLATGAVTAPKLAPNAVNSTKITNAAVTAPKIAPGAVNRSKIADGEVTPEKLSFNAATLGDLDLMRTEIDNMAVLVTLGASAFAFLTSETYNGNLGGLAGADQKCQDLAEAVGLPGFYFAWLSDSNPASAPANRFSQAVSAYLRPRFLNTPPLEVALDWTDLTDGGDLILPINVTELEDLVFGAVPVWTNVTVNGVQRSASNHCGDWTSASNGAVGQVGEADDTSTSWSGFAGQMLSCDMAARLYCIGQ